MGTKLVTHLHLVVLCLQVTVLQTFVAEGHSHFSGLVHGLHMVK
jgi:hypothetical protein